MSRILTSIVIALSFNIAFGAFSNLNSVLLGEQAAGMGGACTGVSGDSAAAGFYNPASLGFIKGTSLSASATIFNKFDTTYGADQDILDAGDRINRGFFRTVPSSFGNVYKWKKYAFGLSIVVPDYDFFSGNIRSNDNVQSFLNYTDESLWSGFTGSYKIDHKQSIGMTLYYTARSLIRSTQDRTVVSPSREIITSEEKSITHNGIVAILGYFNKVSPAWSWGVSARLPAMNISGQGSYYRSTTDTASLPSALSSYKNVNAKTYIPPRYAIGTSYKLSDQLMISADASYSTARRIQDFNNADATDDIEYKDTLNGAIGFEYRFKDPKFDFRAGIFTNNSSHPEPSQTPTQRGGDSLNLRGFSANIAFNSTENFRYTIGGFYSGGQGFSVQQTGNQLGKIKKDHQVFTLLVSTAVLF